MQNTKLLKWAGGIGAALVVGSLIYGPLYKQRDGALKIEAAQQLAAQKRQDTLAQAEADKDAAIIRASGVAEANKIMGDSIRANGRFFLSLQRRAEKAAAKQAEEKSQQCNHLPCGLW